MSTFSCSEVPKSLIRNGGKVLKSLVSSYNIRSTKADLRNGHGNIRGHRGDIAILSGVGQLNSPKGNGLVIRCLHRTSIVGIVAGYHRCLKGIAVSLGMNGGQVVFQSGNRIITDGLTSIRIGHSIGEKRLRFGSVDLCGLKALQSVKKGGLKHQRIGTVIRKRIEYLGITAGNGITLCIQKSCSDQIHTVLCRSKGIVALSLRHLHHIGGIAGGQEGNP